MICYVVLHELISKSLGDFQNMDGLIMQKICLEKSQKLVIWSHLIVDKDKKKIHSFLCDVLYIGHFILGYDDSNALL